MGVDIDADGVWADGEQIPWSAVYDVRAVGHGITRALAEVDGERRVVTLRGAEALERAHRAWWVAQLAQLRAERRFEVRARLRPSALEVAGLTALAVAFIGASAWFVVPLVGPVHDFVLEQPAEQRAHLWSLVAIAVASFVALPALPIALAAVKARDRSRAGRWHRLELRRTGVIAEGAVGEVAFFPWDVVELRGGGVWIGDTLVPLAALDRSPIAAGILLAKAGPETAPTRAPRWWIPALGAATAAAIVYFEWPVSGPPAYGCAAIVAACSWGRVLLEEAVARASKKAEPELLERLHELADATGWFDAEQVWRDTCGADREVAALAI